MKSAKFTVNLNECDWVLSNGDFKRRIKHTTFSSDFQTIFEQIQLHIHSIERHATNWWAWNVRPSFEYASEENVERAGFEASNNLISMANWRMCRRNCAKICNENIAVQLFPFIRVVRHFTGKSQSNEAFEHALFWSLFGYPLLQTGRVEYSTCLASVEICRYVIYSIYSPVKAVESPERIEWMGKTIKTAEIHRENALCWLKDRFELLWIKT